MLRAIAGIPIALLACLVLFLPAWINGSPIYWYDSLAHLHGGSSALNTTLGVDTRFSNMERAARPDADVLTGEVLVESADTAPLAAAGPVDEGTEYRISMARSPYYSVIVVFLSDKFGPFAPIIAQVLTLVAAGFFLLRAVFQDRRNTPAFYLMAATSVSTAGVFCATLIPDVLAPLGILAAAVLFSFYDRLGALDKWFWFTALVLSLISHTTHIAITILLIPVGFGLALWRAQASSLAPALICLCAVVIGFFSLQAFSKTVEAIYDYKPRSFPMIAASVIVDGPGVDYLKATCPDNGYIYCDYLHTEAQNIDEFLWSHDKTKGVYHFADPETRNQMSDQQFQFLIDVLKYDFGGQFQASFSRFLAQMQQNSLRHMGYDGGLQKALATTLPEPDRQLALESAAYADRFPFSGLSILSQTFSLLALVGTILILLRASRENGSDPLSLNGPSSGAMISFTVLVIWSIIANAGITGVLSNPQGRYGARVLWLLLVMFAVVFAWYRYRAPQEAAVSTTR